MGGFGALALLALGRLGGGVLTHASDLDLVYLFTGDFLAESDGPKPLGATQYFNRLGQRITNALSVHTASGPLYEVDTRLRPSGAQGLLAVSTDSFARYQREQAWTWEHMALTRARVITGCPALGEHVTKIIRTVVGKPREDPGLVIEVASMRERIDKKRRTDNVWKLKHVRGGLLDIEFIAQYLQLRDASRHAEILSQETDLVFERLARCGIMEEEDAASLADAARLMRRLQALLRLTVGVSRDEGRYPAGLRQALAKAAGVETFDEVRDRLMKSEESVRAFYARYVQQPAEAGILDENKKESERV